MGDDDPRCGTIFDPRGMVGKIYKEDHYSLIHTKYEGLVVSEKIFFMFFFSNDSPGAWPLSQQTFDVSWTSDRRQTPTS